MHQLGFGCGDGGVVEGKECCPRLDHRRVYPSMLAQPEQAVQLQDLISYLGDLQGFKERVGLSQLIQSVQGNHVVGDVIEQTLPGTILGWNSFGVVFSGFKSRLKDLPDLEGRFVVEIVPPPARGRSAQTVAFHPDPFTLLSVVGSGSALNSAGLLFLPGHGPFDFVDWGWATR